MKENPKQLLRKILNTAFRDFSSTKSLTHRYDGFDLEIINVFIKLWWIKNKGSGRAIKSSEIGMIQALSSMLSMRERGKILSKIRAYILGLSVEKRLDFLSYLGDALLIFFYGKPPKHFEHLDKALRSRSNKQNEEGHYCYVPLDTKKFVSRFLRPLYEKYGERKSLIDVGCGIGDKLLLAWLSGLFEKITGIEYERLTAGVACYSFINLHSPRIRIIHGDAFEHNYENYDTLYFYCPIGNPKVMGELYIKIFDTIKCGSIMMEMLPTTGVSRLLQVVSANRTYPRGFFFMRKYRSRKHKKDMLSLEPYEWLD